ncbi:MAG: sulfotransferase [Steroidobacteraceae bacterium]
MGHAIHIDDLAAPRLSEAQAGALAWGETVTVDFSEAAILDAACQRTGLADFGPDDFRGRLRVLREAWDSDPEITRFHRTVLQGYLVRYASNRLLIHDTLRRHPEILAEPIEQPVIVVGLPRSGTTHLVNLLASDRRLHSLQLWESYEPVPVPGEPAPGDESDPRFRRCAQAWAGMQQVTPLIAAMHPMNPGHIHEELELMGPDFASYNFEWLGLTPAWRDHYYAHDQAPHYAYMKNVLRLLQWRRGERKRWVLKCPQHLEQLPVLMKTFPDATVVFTHRDPVAVIQSTVTMQAYTQRMNRRHVALPALFEYWSDRIEHLLRACVRDRGLVPAGRSVDSPFHMFMGDQWGTMARVYARAGLELDATARGQLTGYIAEHPRGKEGQVIYDLRRDFDVDPLRLRERFRFYIDRFAVKAEVG